MAAYIDLNPVRAGVVSDPKDYRFCGYAEAVAGRAGAGQGLQEVWGAYADGSVRERLSMEDALRIHREVLFGHRAAEPGLPEREREQALRALQRGGAALPKATVLRCRVRYFTDGAILGTQGYVRELIEHWEMARGRRYPPRVNVLGGADWSGAEGSGEQDLACLRGLRKAVFG